MTFTRNAQNLLLFFISVLVLFFNFFDHRLSTLSVERFLDNEFPSERFVFSRLVYDLDHGTESEGGFMLRYDHVDALHSATGRKPYAEFKEKLNGAGTDLYNSHLGLQDDLVFPLWRGLRQVKDTILDHAKAGSRWHKRMQADDLYYYFTVSQGFVALLNAIVISMIVLWASRQYNVQAGWFLLAAIVIFMPALSFFGRSLWWMMWAWFLPFLISLWAYRFNEGRPLKVVMLIAVSLLVGAGVCLRGSMGYEYISTVGIAAAIPPLYYATQGRWSLRTWFVQSAAIGVFALGGLLAALWLHWHALENYGFDPFEQLAKKYQLRASGGAYSPTDSPDILESITTPIGALILTYLYHPQKIAFPQIVLALPFLFWLFFYVRKGRSAMPDAMKRNYDSLAAAIGAGFAGAVSMLILLKGHAAIHGFDIVIWNLPMNFFLALFYWQWLKDRSTREAVKTSCC